jgi:hypothetical protein
MRRASTRNSTSGVIVLGVMAALLAFILAKTLLDVRMAYRAVEWPTAGGRVVYSSVARGCGKGGSYYPVVRYSYTVGGTSYTSRRIAFGGAGCGSRSSAQETSNEYPVGTPVTVYYDPASAGESALIVGRVLGRTWTQIGMLAVVITVMAVMARYSYVAWRRRRMV